jgi:hypothetical protein
LIALLLQVVVVEVLLVVLVGKVVMVEQEDI